MIRGMNKEMPSFENNELDERGMPKVEEAYPEIKEARAELETYPDLGTYLKMNKEVVVTKDDPEMDRFDHIVDAVKGGYDHIRAPGYKKTDFDREMPQFDKN